MLGQNAGKPLEASPQNGHERSVRESQHDLCMSKSGHGEERGGEGKEGGEIGGVQQISHCVELPICASIRMDLSAVNV
eukprot:7325777-Pyramimonas_sp.AAC.1